MKHDNYEVRIDWSGNDGQGTKTYKAYHRDHTISCVGKPQIHGSSDPALRGDRSRYNPEELLVASFANVLRIKFVFFSATFCFDNLYWLQLNPRPFIEFETVPCVVNLNFQVHSRRGSRNHRNSGYSKHRPIGGL
jgi:hypothetical protein